MSLGWKYEVAAISVGEGANFADRKMIYLRRIGLAGSDEGFEAQTRFFLRGQSASAFETLCALVSGNQVL